jgi:hypothetical protein
MEKSPNKCSDIHLKNAETLKSITSLLNEFRALHLQYHESLNSTSKLIDIFEAMKHSSFISWLEKHPTFHIGKEKLITDGLIIKGKNTMQSPNEYLLSLEFLCWTSFEYALRLIEKNDLHLTSVIKKSDFKKIKRMLTACKQLIGEKTIHPNPIKNGNFIEVIEDIINTEEPPSYMQLRDNENLFRTYITKDIMRLHLQLFNNKMSPTFIADSSILISDMIFPNNTLSRSSAITQAKKIKDEYFKYR